MKDWFLTDYDFYACVSAGAILIAAIDYSFFAGILIHKPSWSLAEGVVWIGLSYLVGQISAAPASAFFEHFLGRKVFSSPVSIQLGFARPRWHESAIQALFAQFEYRPMAAEVQGKVKSAVAERLSCDQASLTPELSFFTAFPVARTVADTAARLDRFIALYGFARNVAFSGLLGAGVVSVALLQGRPVDPIIVLVFAGVAVGMFGRFIKFYAGYSAEVFRTFLKVSSD